MQDKCRTKHETGGKGMRKARERQDNDIKMQDKYMNMQEKA